MPQALPVGVLKLDSQAAMTDEADQDRFCNKHYSTLTLHIVVGKSK